MRISIAVLCVLALAASAQADWVSLPPTDNRTSLPAAIGPDAKPINPGDKWPDDNHFRWLIGDLVVPATIGGKQTAGQPVGLKINCGDGGEVWFDGKIQSRYDNDHPALVIVSEQATPDTKVHVAVQVYGKVQGGDRFGEASWTLIDRSRAIDRLTLSLDSAHVAGNVPDGVIGLSQGGGMCDYEDATARKLREGGFKWFRMDNVLTPTVKRASTGNLIYDWKDLDKRVDFIHAIGADAIFSASYMPQDFDAIPDGERHSAPADYDQWEELCFQAASHCLKRGKPVPFWEVWNEENAGRLKPGPKDTGADMYSQLLRDATGKTQTNKDLVRRFEAYCKLYRATALGVRRADPSAKVGGPALASGPFEEKGRGPGVHGIAYTRGLMLYCAQEKLPLDFLSWHEYFQASDVISLETNAMREYLKDFPQFSEAGNRLMLTEWNEAWWPDRPHDHEVGAAWCADSVTRCFIPDRLGRPCLFYAKQSDDGFRGDWGILMKDNVPKATYNVAKVFNSLRGRWIPVQGGDADISAVAAWEAERPRLNIVLVNFRYQYDVRRRVRIASASLPTELKAGKWRQWTIDATHSNVWNDRAHADLEQTGSGNISTDDFERTLAPNSVTLLELDGKP